MDNNSDIIDAKDIASVQDIPADVIDSSQIVKMQDLNDYVNQGNNKPASMTWGEVGKSALGDYKQFMDSLSNLSDAALHPIDTLKSIGGALKKAYDEGHLTEGALDILKDAVVNPVKNTAERVGDVITNPVEGTKRVLAQPISSIMDALMTKDIVNIATKGIAKAIPSGTKVGHFISKVPEEHIAEYLERPEEINNAKSVPEIAEDIKNNLSNIDDLVSKKQQEAIDALNRSGVSYDKDDILNVFNNALDKASSGISDVQKQTANTIENYIDRINENLGKKSQISEIDLKKIIQDLDKDLSYTNSSKIGFDDVTMRQIRSGLDDILKSNENYADATKEVSELLKLKEDMMNKLGIKYNKVRTSLLGDDGYYDFGNIEDRLNKMLTPKGINRSDLETLSTNLNNKLGYDLKGNLDNLYIKNSLNRFRPQGSADINLGAATGLGLGGVVGAQVGEALGGMALGTTLGGMAMRYIEQNPKFVIDLVKKGSDLNDIIVNHPITQFVKNISDKVKLTEVNNKLALGNIIYQVSKQKESNPNISDEEALKNVLNQIYAEENK